MTITSVPRPPPDLQQVEKVPTKIIVKFPKKPPHRGHLESTTKRPLVIVPMYNFTSVNGQSGSFF